MEKATVTLGYAYADSEVLPCVDDPDSVGEAACIHVESAHVAWHWKAGNRTSTPKRTSAPNLPTTAISATSLAATPSR